MDFGPVLNSFDKQCIVSDCGLHYYEEVKAYKLEWIRVWICIYWRERSFFCYTPFPTDSDPWEGYDVIIKLFHGWCLGAFCGHQIIPLLLFRNNLCSIWSALLFVGFENVTLQFADIFFIMTYFYCAISTYVLAKFWESSAHVSTQLSLSIL